MIVQFALRSLGVGCVVRDFAQEYIDSGRLFELRFNKMIPKREVCIVYDGKARLSAAARALLQIIGVGVPEGICGTENAERKTAYPRTAH